MKRTLFSVLVTACALLVAAPLVAQEPPEVPPAFDRAMDHVAAFLELDDAQMDQWDILIDVRRDTVEPLRDTIATTEAELRDLLAADEYDYTAIGEATVTIAESRQLIGQAHADYLQSFADMLDEEQRRRLGLVRTADRIKPLLSDFRLMGLLVGPRNAPPDDGGEE
jgi:Spy/CpxP family protein refolding chaperone